MTFYNILLAVMVVRSECRIFALLAPAQFRPADGIHFDELDPTQFTRLCSLTDLPCCCLRYSRMTSSAYPLVTTFVVGSCSVLLHLVSAYRIVDLCSESS